jgi:hypothetical protein
MRLVSGAGRWLIRGGAGLAVLMLGCGVAQADTVVPLPDGRQNFTTATGVAVDFSRTGEKAVVSPSLAYNGLSRTATMSGTVYATAPGVTGGTLVTGYLVGCQVDLSGGLSLGGDVYIDPTDAWPEVVPSIDLVPGGVTQVKFGTKKMDPKAGAIGVEYHDRGIQVDGCAGYAQARSFSTLTVTNSRGTAEVTLYGNPFSIG